LLKIVFKNRETEMETRIRNQLSILKKWSDEFSSGMDSECALYIHRLANWLSLIVDAFFVSCR
jgi:hypothetical protein